MQVPEETLKGRKPLLSKAGPATALLVSWQVQSVVEVFVAAQTLEACQQPKQWKHRLAVARHQLTWRS
jgi:hypothetical protein